MQKIVYLLSLFLLFSACNDGDILDVELDFDKKLDICNLSSESFFIYDTKTNPAESLSLIFPRNSFTEEIFNPIENNFPATFDIDGSNFKFNYRTYDGKPEDVICQLLPDSNTRILEDYAASSGKVTTLTTFVDFEEKRTVTIKFLITNVNLDIISLTEVDFGTYTYIITL